MTPAGKILLVEPRKGDQVILKDILTQIYGDTADVTVIADYDLGQAYLSECDVGVCLVAHKIGRRNGLKFIKTARDRNIRCPMILLTDVGLHDVDVAASRAGASDFLVKSELGASLVERSLRYAAANAAALNALAEQSSLLATTLDHTAAGIAALDADSTLTTSNKHFETLLEKLAAHGAGGEVITRQAALGRVIAELGGGSECEIGLTNEDATVFQIRRNRTPHGGSVIFAVDITAQKALQANLLKSKEEVEAANRAKSSLLANLTHELRTPLNSIIGFSELIQRTSECDRTTDFADQIHQSSLHLLEIINTMLAYSRLEAGEHPFESKELLELDCLVEFCIKQVAPDASARDIVISSHQAPGIIGLHCDATSLRRIFINLLSNAVRFSEDGGKIEVGLELRKNGALQVSVRDYGIGMEPDQVEAAFLPFRQLGVGYDRKYSGTGLGLPMVKSLAALHDAEISIDTAPGQGTCVKLVFPASRVITASSLQMPARVKKSA